MEKRILVVDDESVVLDAIGKILRKTECRIDTATSAVEALKLLTGTSYDVVITDLMMPQMNGLELMQRMRETGDESLTIMLTGYPSVRTALKAKKLGAFEYVTKPFTRQELLSVVVRALRQSAEGHTGYRAPMKMENPESVYLIPEHAWARLELDRTARIGMTRDFASSVGDIFDIELPAEGCRLQQGRTCVVVRAEDDVEHDLHSPLSGRVLEVNKKLEENAGLAAQDPEGSGWLLRLAPENPDSEIENLMPAVSAGDRARRQETDGNGKRH
jgi:CheY-like chemotaxis protein/glycine cleavage system H lipoate-binding protein